jgi:MFS family permease
MIAAMAMQEQTRSIETDIPTRLDRLPWSRFHLLLVCALGITWILDGLEVTIVGSIGPVLQNPHVLGLTSTALGAAASFYVAGAVAGALISGWISDRVGRRAIFFVTLSVYLAGVLLTAMSWNFWSFAVFRLVTGAGIGGEYSAVNSAIDELVPAKYRGRIDLIVNGSFWLGAAAGAGASLVILDPHFIAQTFGWRLGFGAGGILGFGVLLLRRFVPESPRWLVVHCRSEEAEHTLGIIERKVSAMSRLPLAPFHDKIIIHPRPAYGLAPIFRSMLKTHRKRSLLALSLMIAQAFLYNAVFFTYGIVLTHFYHVPDRRTGIYFVPLALGNFLGPLLLGPFFDTIGRKVMISATFAASAFLLFVTAALFADNRFSPATLNAAWIAVFFFASAAASSAYLTASEIFPLEARALAIACFYAAGTAIGGVLSPLLFAWLIATGSRVALSGGYALAGLLLCLAAFAEWLWGVAAEGKSLESIAAPISSGGT